MKSQEIQDMHYLYMNAFKNTAREYSENPCEGIKPFINKLIVYGVKAVNTKPATEVITQEEAVSDFEFVGMIIKLIETLTPAEFVNLFPITKEFDGDRNQTKDYFYTREYIKTLESDKPIGENVLEFLWEYSNWEITIFNVTSMSYLDNLHRLQGQPTVWESLCNENGLKTYTTRTDLKGRQFMVDRETGKSFRVKKRMPRYIKLVK